MAVVHYDDGTLYGDSEAFYGRIDADMAAAQESHYRETGLIVQVVDERINRWEHVVGQDPALGNRGGGSSRSQTYDHYRGRADACVLDNGNIVRVRTNTATRHIEYQEITDPEDTGQWTSWTTYNTDDNFGVAVAPDGNDFIIYHVKSGGVYRNNSLVWSQSAVIDVKCHKNSDGRQRKERLWIKTVHDGIIHPALEPPQLVRKFDWYVVNNITTQTPQPVGWNYIWQRSDVASISRPDGKIIRVSSYPQYAPVTLVNSGESMVTTLLDSWSQADDPIAPRLIRGIAGEPGYVHIANCEVFKVGEFYYLWYVESSSDEHFSPNTNLNAAQIWHRSKDGVHWTEPTHSGYRSPGGVIAGMIQHGDWVYLLGNDQVHRRPANPAVHDITNYVPELEWETPRDNQPGNGSVVVANPADVNSYLSHLSDKKIIIQPGIKAGSDYLFTSLEDHWITGVDQILDGATSRLNLQLGNIWSRLENPFRDVYNFIGRTDYVDFRPGAPNEPFAYFFDQAGTGESEPTVVNGHQLRVPDGNAALWTGWKGFNPFIQARFFGTPPYIIYLRWEDEKNHMKAVYDGTNVRLYEVIDGNESQIGSTRNIGSTNNWGIRVLWKRVEVYANGSFVNTLTTVNTQSVPGVYKPGYAGFGSNSTYRISHFRFEDLEHNFTTEQLIRQALAMGDYHDVVIASNQDKQYALMWGPQTDVNTAGDGLRNLLEADKLDLVWRDGIITIGKFTDQTVVKEIENRIIETSLKDEANKRINLARIDGNEHPWVEVDREDARFRDRMVNAYHDLPDLTTKDSVMQRGIEEIRRSKMARSPGGLVPLFFDLWRMDTVRWVDNAGNASIVRIEGISVRINQSTTPSQRQEIDTSLVEDA